MLPDDPAQVLQVPGQPIHAMNDHGIGLPDEGNQALQLRMLETELKELVTSDDKSKVASLMSRIATKSLT